MCLSAFTNVSSCLSVRQAGSLSESVRPYASMHVCVYAGVYDRYMHRQKIYEYLSMIICTNLYTYVCCVARFLDVFFLLNCRHACMHA